MAKFGEISWKPTKGDKKLEKELPKVTLESFLQYFHLKFPDKETFEYSKVFHREYTQLEKAFLAAKKAFHEIPLVSAYLDWVQEAYSQTAEEIEIPKILLSEGFIGLKDSEGATWTLSDAAKQDPTEIYQAIRCRRDLSLVFREQLVNAYKSFLEYLSSCTQGYIKPKYDFEDTYVRHRSLSLRDFVLFADQLNDSLKLVAKLLYFGGNRSLEEVLRLTIQEVDFESRHISFGSKVVPYPLHVFADIKAVVGKRSKGDVFRGRKNAPLNPTTVFRNFKEAGDKAGFWMVIDFLPSTLTKNK